MSFIIQEQATPVLFEVGNEEATGAGGTIDFYLADQDFLYYEGNASANFAIDLAYDAATTLDDALNVDDLVTITLAAQNGATPYVLTNFQIDGGAGTVTINWAGGGPPVLGSANKIDNYTFKILKTSGNAYTVFASVVSTAEVQIPSERQLLINSGISAIPTLNIANENILFYNATSTNDFGINITYATGVSLNTAMATGEVVNCSLKYVAGSASPAQLFGFISLDSGASNYSIFSTFSGNPSSTPNILNQFDFQIAKVGSASFDIDMTQTLLTYPGRDGPAFTAEMMIVAGGGPSQATGGGGGAGGLLYYGTETPKTPNGTARTVVKGTTYTITVGAGGAIGSAGGSNSSVVGGTLNLVSTGGGRGGNPGLTGGSGGNAAPGTSGQGFGGGSSGGGGYGGGGGAGQAGNPADQFSPGSTKGGVGGNGLQYSINANTATYYAGGGSGAGNGWNNNFIPGSLGGGGSGGDRSDVPPSAGTDGLGGGAGASPSNTRKGGDGTVVIRYKQLFGAAAATTGSPTVTSAGGWISYRWTTSGSITF